MFTTSGGKDYEVDHGGEWGPGFNSNDKRGHNSGRCDDRGFTNDDG